MLASLVLPAHRGWEVPAGESADCLRVRQKIFFAEEVVEMRSNMFDAQGYHLETRISLAQVSQGVSVFAGIETNAATHLPARAVRCAVIPRDDNSGRLLKIRHSSYSRARFQDRGTRHSVPVASPPHFFHVG